MKFNGVDPRSLYPGISVAKEIPPGTVTSQLETISGTGGEMVVGRTIQQGEYIARINIAGKNASNGWEIHRLLKAWARPMDATTSELVPTHWPSVAYDAILKEISPPEFRFGFVVIDVVFALPRPIAHDRAATTANTGGTAGALSINVGGSSYIRPIIRAKASAATSDMVLYVDDKPYVRVVTPIKSGDVLAVYADGRLELTEASTGKTVDVTDKVDYVATDLQAMQEALTPGKHAIRTAPASALDMEWRCEWV